MIDWLNSVSKERDRGGDSSVHSDIDKLCNYLTAKSKSGVFDAQNMNNDDSPFVYKKYIHLLQVT